MEKVPKLIKFLNKPPVFLKARNTLLNSFNRKVSQSSAAVSEQEIKDLLNKRFGNAKKIQVNDVSGGCGSMFDIYVECEEFKGLTIVKQHKAITETLKEQIRQIHGLRIQTKAAS